MEEMSEKYTKKQGQYLAYIYNYTKVNGRAPAHADLQDYFEVSPPSVHQMLLKLEERGLITKEAGVSRSIKVVIDVKELPLDW
ncbi:LexA family protein [Vibrio parahaemolyticus]|uniref:LexA family protein n=2 Tax=Vibrio parahaemolyticus TaxID=670 RepID=UPI00267944F9|nr:MarR family transcriptional regulator [Vibrio parahaemolyticus]